MMNDNNKKINQLSIIAFGLMGGSLGLAAKAAKAASFITGYARRKETRDLVVKYKAADNVESDVRNAFKNTDLTVFCTPVNVTVDLIKQNLNHFPKGSVVTDVGSTKSVLVEQAEKVLRESGVEFIGSHPLVGSEKTGIQAASESLYESAVVILTPTASVSIRAIDKVKHFWEKLGCSVYMCSPEEHDNMVARTSHLPHLVSFLLALTGAREPSATLKKFCGAGFWDTTRIAESAPAMWTQIFHHNRKAVLEETEKFKNHLQNIYDLLNAEDYKSLQGMLQTAADLHKKLKGFDI
jgi:prephenate dehydrogenase